MCEAHARTSARDLKNDFSFAVKKGFSSIELTSKLNTFFLDHATSLAQKFTQFEIFSKSVEP